MFFVFDTNQNHERKPFFSLLFSHELEAFHTEADSEAGLLPRADAHGGRRDEGSSAPRSAGVRGMFDSWLPLLPSSDIELAPQAQIEGLDPPAVAQHAGDPSPPAQTHILLLGDGNHIQHAQDIGSSGVVQPDDPWLDSDWARADHTGAGQIVGYDQDVAATGEGAGSSTGGPAGSGHGAHVLGHSDGRLSDAAASGASSLPTGAGDAGYTQDAAPASFAHGEHSATGGVGGGSGSASSFAHGEHNTASGVGGGSSSASKGIYLNPNAAAYLGAQGSESAVSADASCFKFDDMFSYHYYAGKGGICTQSSEDNQMVHDYVQLAPPLGTPGVQRSSDSDKDAGNATQLCRPSPSHFLLAGHACVLAAIQGAAKRDFHGFKDDATANAASVTPVGAFVLRELVLSDGRTRTKLVFAAAKRRTPMYVELFLPFQACDVLRALQDARASEISLLLCLVGTVDRDTSCVEDVEDEGETTRDLECTHTQTIARAWAVLRSSVAKFLVAAAPPVTSEGATSLPEYCGGAAGDGSDSDTLEYTVFASLPFGMVGLDDDAQDAHDVLYLSL